MRQSARLVINPVTVDNFAVLFNVTPVDRASESYDGPDLKLFIFLVGTGALVNRGSTDDLILLQSFADQGSPSVTQHVVSVESSSLLLHTIKK